MKTKTIRTVILAATMPLIQSLSAQLPMLEPPWLGYHAVADESKFRFLVDVTGQFQLMVVNKGGAPIELYPVTLQFLATETLPDGSVRDLPMKLNSVESADPPTAKLKKIVFQSKLTEQPAGQPTLEVTIEITSGGLLASARITDKGEFGKNPLQPVIRAVFPGFYAQEQVGRETWEKKQAKDFDKMLTEDSVSMKHLDGKTVKLACAEKLELTPDKINAARSSMIEVNIGAYQNRKIEFVAAPNSSLTLGNAAPASLHSGFALQWSADPAKDVDGKVKLAIRFK